jgi:DNA-binding Lrp family transcriptional regulator
MDEKLLEILEDNARISERDLAKCLDMSEDDVRRKIDSLRKKGVIKKFKTVIDWEKAGKEFVSAYIEVKVTPEARTGFSDFGQLIASYDNVEEVCVASGEYDLFVKMKGKDLKDVSNFVTEVLAPKKHVTSTYTHFILKKFKENGVVLMDGQKEKKLVISP